jgi:hypothetical protein
MPEPDLIIRSSNEAHPKRSQLHFPSHPIPQKNPAIPFFSKHPKSRQKPFSRAKNRMKWL